MSPAAGFVESIVCDSDTDLAEDGKIRDGESAVSFLTIMCECLLVPR
jgi:hypothetical protein